MRPCAPGPASGLLGIIVRPDMDGLWLSYLLDADRFQPTIRSMLSDALHDLSRVNLTICTSGQEPPTANPEETTVKRHKTTESTTKGHVLTAPTGFVYHTRKEARHDHHLVQDH